MHALLRNSSLQAGATLTWRRRRPIANTGGALNLPSCPMSRSCPLTSLDVDAVGSMWFQLRLSICCMGICAVAALALLGSLATLTKKGLLILSTFLLVWSCFKALKVQNALGKSGASSGRMLFPSYAKYLGLPADQAICRNKTRPWIENSLLA